MVGMRREHFRIAVATTPAVSVSAAVAEAGFTQFDMSDVSSEMIEITRQLSCVYRRLTCFTLDAPFPFETGVYHVITAMGIIADKYTQPQIIRQLLDKLRSGSLLIFSLNNHTLESPDYLRHTLTRQRMARRIFWKRMMGRIWSS